MGGVGVEGQKDLNNEDGVSPEDQAKLDRVLQDKEALAKQLNRPAAVGWALLGQEGLAKKAQAQDVGQIPDNATLSPEETAFVDFLKTPEDAKLESVLKFLATGTKEQQQAHQQAYADACNKDIKYLGSTNDIRKNTLEKLKVIWNDNTEFADTLGALTLANTGNAFADANENDIVRVI